MQAACLCSPYSLTVLDVDHKHLQNPPQNMIRSDVRIEALFLWSNSCLFLFLRSDNLTISCWHSSTDCDSSQISCLLAITIDITHGHDGVFLELKEHHFLVGWDNQSCGCEEMWSTESWLSPRGPQQKSEKSFSVKQISANQHLV